MNPFLNALTSRSRKEQRGERKSGEIMMKGKDDHRESSGGVSSQEIQKMNLSRAACPSSKFIRMRDDGRMPHPLAIRSLGDWKGVVQLLRSARWEKAEVADIRVKTERYHMHMSFPVFSCLSDAICPVYLIQSMLLIS